MNTLQDVVAWIWGEETGRIKVKKTGVYRFLSSYRYAPHSHMELEVNYVKSGNCVMVFPDEYVPLKSGECVVVTPCVKHGFLVDTKNGCKLIQAEFSVEVNETDIEDLLGVQEKHPYYRLKNCEAIVPFMEQAARIHRMETQYQEYKQTQLKLAMIQLLMALKYHIEKSRGLLPGVKNKKILEIMKYLQEHYHENVNIEKLAQAQGISSRYVRKYFAGEIGMTCTDYVTVLRINKAKELLWESDKSITSIALEIGYGTPQYFSRTFKNEVGMTPLHYREKWKYKNREEEK